VDGGRERELDRVKETSLQLLLTNIIVVCLVNSRHLDDQQLLLLRTLSRKCRDIVALCVCVWTERFNRRFKTRLESASLADYIRLAREQRFPRVVESPVVPGPGYYDSKQRTRSGWSRHRQLASNLETLRERCLGEACLACGHKETFLIYRDQARLDDGCGVDWSEGREWQCRECRSYSHRVTCGRKNHCGIQI
jgi:hypothetical protein